MKIRLPQLDAELITVILIFGIEAWFVVWLMVS